jgi:hypothetical protein
MIGDAFEYMAAHPVPGVLCEFGVWQGLGLQSIAECSEKYLGGGIPIYGFDSFEGMPKTEVIFHDNNAIDWRPGGYSDTSLEIAQNRVPEARLIQGVFADLAPLGVFGIDKVRFARLDCDIYEGYRDALRLLTPCLSSGTVLLFDEVVPPDDPRYRDGIRDSGERAVREWQESTGRKLRVLHNQWTESLTVVE